MSERYINPKYADLVAEFDAIVGENFDISSEMNCSQCGGSGRHMITDTDGKIKSVTCMACSGSGKRGEVKRY